VTIIVDEQTCLLGLLLAPGIGEARLKSLLRRYGSAKRVLDVGSSELKKSGILNSEINGQQCIRAGMEEAKKVEELGARVVSLKDSDYPANLEPLDEAPPLVYVLGEIRDQDCRAVAVVGSRRPSAYGRAVSERLSYQLAARGVTVVSGLANGIDAAAHRGALRAGGRTIAVLGCGLDVNYPAGNRKLREKIVCSGAVITEFPFGTKPLPGNFPKRNRIVSGLSLGVVVVEAAPKSGTFSTVKWAADQGKEVFAVPGDINRRTSEGTNRLISQGAKLTTCAEDILEEVGIRADRREAQIDVVLTEGERRAVDALESGPVHIDDIARDSEMSVKEALTTLLSLELKGIVRQAPGKIFSLEHRYG
jgi:DNA processing protein